MRPCSPEKIAILKAKAEARRGFSDAEMLKWMQAGERLFELAIRFDCADNTIRRAAQRLSFTLPKERKDSPHTAVTDALLRLAWDQQKSTQQIGRELGMNKNQIVGRANRLDLPCRPNPKRPDRPDAPPRQRLRSVRIYAKAARADLPPNWTMPVEKPRKAAEKPKIVAPPKPVGKAPIKLGKVSECLFPVGDPKTRGFRYCDDPTEPGEHYCAMHFALAHEKKRAA
jgi:GcrA cell cycle regulator